MICMVKTGSSSSNYGPYFPIFPLCPHEGKTASGERIVDFSECAWITDLDEPYEWGEPKPGVERLWRHRVSAP